MKQVPDVLNRMVDLVLDYRPKSKSKKASKRKRSNRASKKTAGGGKEHGNV